VKGDFHARFCERRRVGFPPPTHLETYSGGSDRASNIQQVGRGRESCAGILSSAIGVEYRALDERIVPGSHGQRVDHQFAAKMVSHGIADTGFSIAVNDRGQIDPALPCRNVGNVAYHFLAGSIGGEIPIHQVRDRAGIAGGGGGRPVRPGLAGDQAKLAHQLAHELGADLLALTHQLSVHPTRPHTFDRKAQKPP
jgi:hypothetical protein